MQDRELGARLVTATADTTTSPAPGTPDDPRDRPSEEYIATVRDRYPTEREIDRVLTRKLERRGGPPFAPLSVARMTECLHAFLEAHVEGSFTVSDARWLSGGASKIQLGFTLEWDAQGAGRTKTRLAARMEPTESLNTTSRLREFQLLRAFEGILPVPPVHWVDEEGQWFPEPTLVYAYAEGVTRPTAATTGLISGTGTNFGPGLRAQLGRQFVEHLAMIHTFDHATAELDAFDRPAVGTTESALAQLNRARRVWEEDRGEDLPIVDVAADWLTENLPVLDHVSVVHGDYRAGNFLFDESDGRITAWLDWERGSLGDRHRDLAWTTAYSFGHFAEDGKTYLVSGVVPLETFFEDYERASGLTVDPERLKYYTIFNRYQLILSTLGTAYRVIRLGKSHQDVLLSRIEGSAYMMADELRAELEEIL
jgi:aminoglycoside phosphotransferase (APT) family kinase protein